MRSEEIYEALFDEDAFAALPDLLTQAVGGRSALIQWRSRSGEFETLAYNHWTPAFMAGYSKGWAQHDPWVHAALHPDRVNKLQLMQRHVPDTAMANSAIYNDFIRASGDDTFRCAGVGISGPWGSGLVGINRARQTTDFEEAEVYGLKPLLRGLVRVLRVRSELASARHDLSISTAAQDRIGMGIVIAHEDGRVLQTNAAAEVVLRRRDGPQLKAGIVTAVQHKAASRLSSAIADATRTNAPAGSTVVIDRGPGKAPYLVTVTPIVGAVGRSKALLLFRDPDAEDAFLVSRLRTLFGLSNVEAVIAADLGAGFSAAEITLKRGVRASTVKTQLQSIMAKTGCRRQSEIAARVAALPPLQE